MIESFTSYRTKHFKIQRFSASFPKMWFFYNLLEFHFSVKRFILLKLILSKITVFSGEQLYLGLV